MSKLCIPAVAALTLTALHAEARPRRRGPPVPPVETVFKPNTAPVSPHAKIFLVAGSSLTSAFAREVADQRKMWLAAGFHEDEIECYYPVPLQEDLLDDPHHFLTLAPELASCHQVSVATLHDHLQAVAAGPSKPPFLYLYVTSHGDKPISVTLQSARETDGDYWALQRESHYPVFEQYQIVVEGLRDGTATASEIFGALRGGRTADELYLTPTSLQHMLSPAFDGIPKYLVIQGCFSGGFIEGGASEPMTQLPDITILTAARHDRSSFGCEPGGRTTFYGGAFNEALGKVIADPRKIDWGQLSETVQGRVRALEKRQKTAPPSLPQFFTNQVKPQAPRAP